MLQRYFTRTNAALMQPVVAWRRRLIALIVIAHAPVTHLAAQEVARPAASVKDLGGDWTVDLRPTLDAPAYLKAMRLTISPEQVVQGTFYDSDISSGRATASKGRACFAFTTTDGVGKYQTSGCLAGDRIEGQTWAEARGFLMTWSAVRSARQ